MSGSILSSISKVLPPRTINILDRYRLFTRLDESRDRKLLLILGQGAQGKSLLAASYLESCGRPYAWINLSSEDSDPTNLYLALIQAVRFSLTHTDLRHLIDLVSISLGPREHIPLFREWATSFYNFIPTGFQICFDGLDMLSTDSPSFLLLRVLIEEAPVNLRLIMISRTAPPLDIERRQMNHEATVIDNYELAFTPEETNDFFFKIHGMFLSREQLAVIQHLTEGWAGGLILTCEAMSRSDQGFKQISKAGLATAGLRNKTFQYFSEQVFSSLPEHVQDFLIKTSIFDVVDSSIIQEFIGVEHGEQILGEMSRRNLFVTFYHASGSTHLYRYHQLFSEFLRAKFEGDFSFLEKKNLKLKAALLLEEKGNAEAALRYYFEVKDHERAVIVLERIGLDVIKSGRTGDMARWLEALPPDSVAVNPWLLTYLCITRRFVSCQVNIENLSLSIKLFQERNDVRGQLMAMAYLIENNMALFLFDQELIKKGEDLLARMDFDQHPYERSLLMQNIGFAYGVRGNPRLGLLACQNAGILAEWMDNPILLANVLIHTTLPLTGLGDFGANDKLSPRIERLLHRLKSNELHIHYQINYSLYLIFKGELNRAKESCQKLLEDVEKEGMVYAVPVSLLYNYFCCVFMDNFPAAEQLSNQILNSLPKQKDSFLRNLVFFFKGIAVYRKGDYSHAVKIIAEPIESFSSEIGRSEMHFHYARLVKGILDYHIHDTPVWENLLEETGEYFERIQSKLFLIQYHLVKALLGWKKKDYSQASLHLEAGFGDAEKISCSFFIALSQSDTVKACAIAVELQVGSIVDYAAHLLSGRYALDSVAELERLSRHRNPAVRDKAKVIRQTIHLNCLPRLRIETLGGFQVWRGQTIMTDNDWGGSQSKTLMKAIVNYGGREVPKDVVMDCLWPDVAPAAAERNFKAALHRLRKAIEPDMKRDFKSSYIALSDNIISLTDLVEHIDMEEFLALAVRGVEQAKRGRERDALTLYDRALSLYRGEFLSADFNLPWAEGRREEINRCYLDTLFQKAHLHEILGAPRKAISAYNEVIEAEPTFEEAYRRLMTLHSKLGRREQVLKIYQQCQQKLSEILNTEPEDATTLLFNRIHEDV